MCRNLKDKKVLLVDDDDNNLKLASAILSIFKMDITCVNNGLDAIDKLNEDSFDLIIMDLYMPVMNGIDCIKYIRENLFLSTPIIILTAGIIDFHNELEKYVKLCINKPYNKSKLRNAVNEYID